jgi:hypothetical protein
MAKRTQSLKILCESESLSPTIPTIDLPGLLCFQRPANPFFILTWLRLALIRFALDFLALSSQLNFARLTKGDALLWESDG